MAFSYSYATYDGDGTVDQGTLASTYSTALIEYLMTDGADYVAFLAYLSNGNDVDAALTLKALVEGGSFTVSGLFSAAQSKTGAVDGDSITDPTPTLMVTMGDGSTVSIDLTLMMGDLDTETWNTITKSGTIYHTREFFSTADAPEGYETDWADATENQAPTADPITWGVTEYDEHAVASSAADPETIDLLTDAGASDPDGDALSVVAGTVKIDNGDGTYSDLPSYLSYADGKLTIDRNSAEFDTLYKDDTLQVTIAYDITDGQGHTITNSVDLTITGTADQFHYSYPTGSSASASQTLAPDGSDPDGSFASPDGSFDVTLDPADLDADAFDFSGSATVTVTGDINKINGTVDGQEWVAVQVEETNTDVLGPVQYGTDSNKEGVAFHTSDTATMDFQSEDQNVLVEYDATNEVAAGGNITVSIGEFDYWL